ncbi:putative motility protein [Paenibacillus sp. MBLB4367]|uniref:putative motility protein n=1 Tax=Paenibacillus sp. MBLB4367 TaxID=3384767 RepID=UPI0039083E84
MNVSGANAALQAAGSADLLQQLIGVRMLDKTMEASAEQTSVMLNDFAAAQQKVIETSVQPHLGRSIDLRG